MILKANAAQPFLPRHQNGRPARRRDAGLCRFL